MLGVWGAVAGGASLFNLWVANSSGRLPHAPGLNLNGRPLVGVGISRLSSGAIISALNLNKFSACTDGVPVVMCKRLK